MEFINPSPIVIEALKHINFNNLTKERNIKVLDIGAGYGKDSLFLAKKGFNVSAVDSSAYFIHKINQLAKIHSVKINTLIADAITYPFENHDIIICNNVLHFLKNNKIRELINKMKKRTNPEGLNVVSFFLEKNTELDNLKSLYNDWQIPHYKKDSYFDFAQKKKIFIELIARKI